MRERPAIQRRPAVTGSLGGRTVATLAELSEERLARGYGGWTRGKRIRSGDVLPGGGRARTGSEEHQDRK